MRNLLTAIVLAVLLAGATGCCNCGCGTVPVSLEGVYNWMHFHGPACRQFPFSCPSCPYYDATNCQWSEPCFCGAVHESDPAQVPGLNDAK